MILETLNHSSSALPYAALTSLQKLFPNSAIFETSDSDFDWRGYVEVGLCECKPKSDHLEEARYTWSQDEDKTYRTRTIGFYDMSWEERSLGLLHLQYDTPFCGPTNRMFIVADDHQTAQDFFEAVCRWSTPIRNEIYVFEEGYWNKDAELFTSIQSSKLDNLILPPGLKETIRNDAANYFAAKERYKRFNIPWKRGLIFIGPPGNGKTHMIKALINDLKQPCLYVKSLKSQHHNQDLSIRQVFEKARSSAPCILVMEDIDALIDDQNRSFFLNELDGFRKNEGLLVVATTNHPEKLDPAILDRPSRFDRKYHFELPALPEREAYLGFWNTQLEPELKLTAEGVKAIATVTDGFSFAYLKELALVSMMAWMNRPEAMDQIMAEQVVTLREQMASTKPNLPATVPANP